MDASAPGTSLKLHGNIGTTSKPGSQHYFLFLQIQFVTVTERVRISFFFSLYHYIKDVLYCKARLRFLEVTELKTKVSSLFYKLNPFHGRVCVKCVPIYKVYKLFFIQTKYDSKSV